MIWVITQAKRTPERAWLCKVSAVVLQQALSRKEKGSNNRRKAVVTVARAHARVADTRRDWQHKLSTAIIRDNQAVYVEDLCVDPNRFPSARGPACAARSTTGTSTRPATYSPRDAGRA